MSEGTVTPLTVVTPINGKTHRDFLPYWEASLNRCIPKANVIVHEYDYDPKDKRFGIPGVRGDIAKMENTHKFSNLLTTDVDALFVGPFTYQPSSPKIRLAMPIKWMIPDTDPEMEPEEWGSRMIWRILDRVGIKNPEPLAVQPWAIWSSADLMPAFKREIGPAEEAISKERFGTRFPLTIAIFTAMWHRLKKQGEAEAMPGGCIFHLPVYPLDRRLEIAKATWERFCNADKDH